MQFYCKVFLVHIFTARRYASAVLAVVVCQFVRLSVRPSHAGIVLKSRKQCSHAHWKVIYLGKLNVGNGAR